MTPTPASDFDDQTAAVRDALAAVLDAADAMAPLFAALAARLVECRLTVNTLTRQRVAVDDGGGTLNSVQAVSQRHRTLAAAVDLVEQHLSQLYDHARQLPDAHAAISSVLASALAPAVEVKP